MLILALAVAATLGLVRYASAGGQRPRERAIEIIARRYGFEPAVIRVERGDRVRLRFASLDVVHGFQLEGYEVDVTVEPLRREFRARRGAGPSEAVEEIAFVNEVVPDLATLARRVFLFTRADVEIFRDALGAARPLDPSSEAAGIPLYTSLKTQYLAYRQLIQDGRCSAKLEAAGPRPPLDMPAWRSRLTGREIDLILAYVLDLSDEGGPPARPAAVVSKGEVQ